MEEGCSLSGGCGPPARLCLLTRMEAGGPLASGRVEAGGGDLMGSLLPEAPVPGPGVPCNGPQGEQMFVLSQDGYATKA